jgi:hypothetical protein
LTCIVSVQARLVVGTLCVCNGVILIAVGLLSFAYVDGTAGKVVAGVCWLAAGFLFGMARKLRRADEWDWPSA